MTADEPALPIVPPGQHGGDVVRVAHALGIDPDDVLDLSVSLNPEAPDLTATFERAASHAQRYPDPERATAMLAEAVGVEAERVVLTNGGAEAIALVAGAEPVGWVEGPEFSLYERHLASLDPGGLRWRSNPSNPLGRRAGIDERADVWDEAFWPLTAGTWTRGDDRSWRLGSLTKLWACPGVRIGYVIAPTAEAAAAVRTRQPRWSVGALAIAAIETLLPVTDLARWSAGVRRRRGELVALLRAHGFRVTDTEANWVLVERPGLRAELIARRVLVRDCASFGLAALHRIAVTDDAGLAALAAAVEHVAPDVDAGGSSSVAADHDEI